MISRARVRARTHEDSVNPDSAWQYQPSCKHRARAQAARRAISLKRTRDAKSRDRRTARAAAFMPVLRRPHDHHRDLRAWLSAEAPPHARSSTNQNRHLMMPSPPIHNCHDTRYSCWLATGHDQVRIGALDWPVMVPQIPSCNVTTTCSPQCDHPRFAPNQPRQPLLFNLFKPNPTTKSP
jgi:hypothetical protein